MRLWIGNMAPGTTDDEVRAFAQKYAARSRGASSSSASKATARIRR